MELREVEREDAKGVPSERTSMKPQQNRPRQMHRADEWSVFGYGELTAYLEAVAAVQCRNFSGKNPRISGFLSVPDS